MDAFTLLTTIVLVAGAFGLILYPLWQQSHAEIPLQPSRIGQTMEEYQARYQATLAAIKDLMFDYEMGKIAPDDYDRLLAKSKLEAAEIRQQIDRLSHSTAITSAATLDVEIERLVSQLRQNQLGNGHHTLLREVDAEIEFLKNIQLDPAKIDEAACLHCGHAFLPGDAFCGGCGQPLPEPIAQPALACSACGYIYQAGDAFCARCGAALPDERPLQPVEEVTTG
ncbi:MAG: hypothetical protein HC875_14735 [Anaerolineales bacterium]|nr:hypothetical protein [Anaerolineales bacterium]